MRRVNSLTYAFLLLIAFALPVAGQNSYTENFTTTAFKDTVNTTADWNLADGELKLFPGFNPTPTGSYDTPGYALGVAVAGDLAFVGDEFAGLQILDISDPSAPSLVGSYDTPGFAFRVALAGDLAFVADFDSGLQILDISDPSAPSLVGSYSTPGTAFSVAVAGDLAFVADELSGLLILDISDPATPSLVGSYDTPGLAWDIAVAGDLAFVADESSGLQILDISDPSAPSLVGSYNTPGLAWGITVVGDLAFVADESSGLQILDISDPATPSLVGSYDTPGAAWDVAVAGDRAFVADQTSGLQIVDISNPALPTLVGSYDTPGNAWGVAVAGDRAFVANEDGGLQILNISYPVAPSFVGSHQMSGFSYDTEVVGDLAFVADFDSGLQIVDISNPALPTPVGSYDTPGGAIGIAVAGDLAFVADFFSGLQILDISDPALPTLVGSYSTLGYALGIAVAGNRAFVAVDQFGLQILDISNPALPTLVGSYDTQGNASGIAVAGDLAFVADGGSGLQILDISNPALPTLVGSYNTPGSAYNVAVAGDHAFVADRDSGLLILDISDPALPTIVGSYDTPGLAYDVAVAGDRAFVADENSGLQVVDISNPAAPSFIANYPTQGEARALVVEGHHAFVIDETNGLQIVQISSDEYDSSLNILYDQSLNIGQSLAVDGEDQTIRRARLVTTQTAGVTWELSADAGGNWTPIIPTATWTNLAVPGTDLLWRSTHTPASTINPAAVSDLTLEWLDEIGFVTSIVDVPNDQGGLVNISFLRSTYDFLDEIVSPIVGYAIYRRVDDPLLAQQILTVDPSVFKKVAGSPELAAFGPEQVRVLGDRSFVMGSSLATSTTLPPGIWEGAGWLPATQVDSYTLRVSTLSDSTSTGGGISVFVTAAVTSTIGLSYFSAPDSAYSVDNIAPGVPLNLAANYSAGGVDLDWDDAPESDFQFHRVYRSTDSIFVPGPGSLVQESTTSNWTDPASDPWGYFYKITTLDLAGNESEAAEPQSVSGVSGNAVPLRTALLAAYPNPFNPSTKLSFELGAPAFARLKIFDAAGRLVTTLVDEQRASGRHEVVWNGQNSAGLSVASGVYLYRFEAGDVVQTKRMMLVK